MKIALFCLVLTFCLSPSSSSRSDVKTPALINAPTGSFCAMLVPNAQKAAEWYRDYLGFSITRSADGPGGTSHTIMLEQQGVLLEIIEAHDSFNLQSISRKKVSELQGIKKFGLVIDRENFDALHRTLVGKKATFIGGVYVDEGLKMRSFIVQDHSGNLIQFFSRITP